jgi:hypothetical protein
MGRGHSLVVEHLPSTHKALDFLQRKKMARKKKVSDIFPLMKAILTLFHD